MLTEKKLLEGIWFEDEHWHCILDNDEGEETIIPLAIYFHILDLEELDPEELENEKRYLVVAAIYPCLRVVSSKFRAQSNAETEADLVDYFGGIPVDALSVNLANKPPEPYHLMEWGFIRHPTFSTLEECESYIQDRKGILDGIFGLIGFYLDRPINLMGTTGWDLILEACQDVNSLQATLARLEKER